MRFRIPGTHPDLVLRSMRPGGACVSKDGPVREPHPADLVLTPLRGIPLIKAGDDLAAIILAALHESGLTLLAGDILVLAQKIVSKAEGRVVDLRTVTPSPRVFMLAKATEKDPRVVELILAESTDVLRH